MAIQKCPCGIDAEYFELECDEPFSAPAELAFKALEVWGAFSVDKRLVHQKDNLVHFVFGNGEHRLVKMLGFNRDDWQKRQRAVHDQRRACESEGCTALGYGIFGLFDPLEPIAFHCEEHMREAGACPGCHRFLAGFEDFDFSGSKFCRDCRSSERLEEEDGEEGNEDDFFDG